MKNYVLIRGPVCSGKSSLARHLSNKIADCYFEINKEINFSLHTAYLLNFENFRSRNVSKNSNFQNNDMATKLLVPYLNLNIKMFTPVIEGLFQEDKLVQYLKNNLKGKGLLVRLSPSLDVCIERNNLKINSLDNNTIEKSHANLKYSCINELVIDNTNLSIGDTANKVFSYFSL